MTPWPILLLGSLGWGEILLILVVVLLLFGSRRLPELMGSLGKGIKEFKKELDGVGRRIDSTPPPEDPTQDRSGKEGEEASAGGSGEDEGGE